MNIIVAHKVSDLTGSGDLGTARQAAAQGLITDCATRIIYRQPAGEIDSARRLLGLTGREAQIVTQLGKGQALWQLGERSFVVQHYRSRLETDLTNTDTGMRTDRQGTPSSAQ